MAGEVTITHNFVSTQPVDPADTAQGKVTSDKWNESHALDGMDELLSAVRDSVIVNMANDNYTMTTAEATAKVIIVFNAGTGKTLTYPAAAVDFSSGVQAILIATGGDITFLLEGTASSFTVYSGNSSIFNASATAITDFNSYLATYARNLDGSALLKMNSAALNGSAGEFEFVNNTPYFNPDDNSVGSIPAIQWALNQNAVTLNNDTTSQSPYESGNDTLTAMANTLYFWEANVYISMADSSTCRIQWQMDGSATIDDIKYTVSGNTTRYNAAALQGAFVDRATKTNITTNVGTAYRQFRITGHLKVSTAGTVIPKMAFDATPTGTNQALTGCFFKMWAAGANTDSSIGQWA